MRHHMYIQTTGKFYIFYDTNQSNDVAQCYAGNGKGLNNGDMENIEDVGPLPVGFYNIGKPVDSAELGPMVMMLDPWKPLYGRGHFWIHGDNNFGNKSASKGCVIMPRMFRNMVAQSGINVLAVVRYE